MGIKARLRKDGKISYTVVYRGKCLGTYHKKSDAEAILRKAKVDFQIAGRVQRLKAVTLATLIDKYTTSLAGKGLAPSTLVAYGLYFGHAKSYLGSDTIVSSIGVEDMENYVAHLVSKKKMAPHTVTLNLQTVGALFEAGRRWGYMSENVARQVTNLPRKRNVTKVRSLSVAEHSTLVEAVDPNYRIMVDVWPRLACRPSEMYGLKVQDLDVEARTLRVERQAMPGAGYKALKHDARPRTLHLDQRTLDQLIEQIGNLRNTDLEAPLFQTPRGCRVSHNHFSSRVLKRAIERGGLVGAVTPHLMRHTGASWLLASGTPLPDVARHLGHADPSVTAKVYSHVVDQVDTSSLERLDKWYAGIKKITAPKAKALLEGRLPGEPTEDEWQEIEAEAAAFMRSFREDRADDLVRLSQSREYSSLKLLLEAMQQSMDPQDVRIIVEMAEKQMGMVSGTFLEHSESEG